MSRPWLATFLFLGLRLSGLCWNLHSVPLRMQKDCTRGSTTFEPTHLARNFFDELSVTTAAANALQSWLNTTSSVQQHPTSLLSMFQHFELGFSFCLVTPVLSGPEAPHTKVEVAAVKGTFGTKGSEWHSCLRSTPCFPVRSIKNQMLSATSGAPKSIYIIVYKNIVFSGTLLLGTRRTIEDSVTAGRCGSETPWQTARPRQGTKRSCNVWEHHAAFAANSTCSLVAHLCWPLALSIRTHLIYKHRRGLGPST